MPYRTGARIDPDTALRQALALHQSGDVVRAATLYRQLLPQLPGNPLLLLVLGTALSQLGQYEEGVYWLGKSLELAPDQPMALSNRGNALRLLKRTDEALKDYDRAIALKPDYAEANHNRGITLADLRRLDEAVASFTRAVEIAPNYAEAYFNRGNALSEMGLWEAALADFDRTLALNPRHAKACNNKGNALVALKRSSEALPCFARAMALDPGLSEAPYNRGCALAKLDRLDEALADFERAITLMPDYVAAHLNRGTTLRELKRPHEALASFNNALAVTPDAVEAKLNIAFVTLLLGDLVKGWEFYEARWKSAAHDTPVRNFSRPLWEPGRKLAGKTLLVHAEQGFGDTVQFCRYVPMAAALGARIVFEAPQALLPLLMTLKGDYTFVEKGRPLPEFDLHCPVMSLPRAFKTDLETVPADVPYLFADPGKLKAVLEKLGGKTRPRLGLAWSGNPNQINDRRRSIPLKLLEPLLGLPFEFHALQTYLRPEDEAALSAFPDLHVHRDDQKDFSDAAALIAAMDLIVTVDTVSAHLAGAMGKPVWILVSWVPDWRWLLDRSDSPWYPTARLFRQPQMGDWGSVIAEVVDRLRQHFT